MREMTVCGKEKRKHENAYAETRHLTMERRDMLHGKKKDYHGYREELRGENTETRGRMMPEPAKVRSKEREERVDVADRSTGVFCRGRSGG